MTADTKTQIAKYLCANPTKKLQFCKETRLKTKTVNKWIRNHKKGLAIHGSSGQPPAIDDDLLQEIKEMSDLRASQNDGMSVAETAAEMKKARKKTLRRRGIVRPPNISVRTMKTHWKKVGIVDKQAEAITSARLKAEFDAFNAASQCIMWYSVKQRIPTAASLINYDATTFVFDPSPSGGKIMVSSDGNVRENKSLKFAPKNNSNSLPIGIKHMCLVAADGFSNENYVFVVSCGNLAKDECHVYEVMGLGRTKTSIGYLVFTQTRAGNRKFFSWFTKTVLVKFIKDIVSIRPSGSNEEVFVCCDGEKMQIDAYFDEETLGLLKEVHAMVGKLPSSTTAIAQPLDAGNIFKGSKTLLKNVVSSVYVDRYLEIHINTAIEAFLVATKNDFTNEHKKKITNGLMACRYVIHECAKEYNVRKSFEIVGIDRTGEINYETIMTQYSVEVSTEEFSRFMSQLPDLSKSFMKQGTITDEELSTIVFCRRLGTVDGKPKDERTLNQQRCVILNHDAVVAAELKKIEAKAKAAPKRRKAVADPPPVQAEPEPEPSSPSNKRRRVPSTRLIDF